MSAEMVKQETRHHLAQTDATKPLVEIRNLKKYFPVTEGIVIQKTVAEVKAIDDISFKILKGELSVWWENRDAAKRRLDVAFFSWSAPHRDRSFMMEPIWIPSIDGNLTNYGNVFRSFFKIPIAR